MRLSLLSEVRSKKGTSRFRLPYPRQHGEVADGATLSDERTLLSSVTPRTGAVRMLLLATVTVGLAGVSGAGCFQTDKGPAPPKEGLYFPTGLAFSPGGKALFITNSDFDLQYKAGTVQVLDAERLRKLIPRAPKVPAIEPGGALPTSADLRIDCAKYGLEPNTSSDALLYPSPCKPIDISAPPDGQGSLIKNTVEIGAFATGAYVIRREPDSDDDKTREVRLLIPVRGDPSLTWLSIDDDSDGGGQSFRMDCGQSGSENRCADAFLAGTDASSNTRRLTIPSEPTDLAVSERGDTVILSHQTSGTVSLFLNGWSTPNAATSAPCGKLPTAPNLEFILGGLPTSVSGVAALPMPRVAKLFPNEIPYTPAFLVTFRGAAEVDVLRYYDDCAASPSRPFLSVSARAGLNLNAGGFDSRSIAVDAHKRKDCEQACSADDKSCLLACATVPVDVFLANRQPASLVLGRATGTVSQFGTSDSVSFYDQVPLAQGPSKVVVGNIIDKNGELKPRVFVLCFDSRALYVYDPAAHRLEGIVNTGRGPSALAFDPGLSAADDAPNFAYLVHFTDSYVGVLDLDMRNPSTYLTLVATVGQPNPPRDSN